MLRHFVCALDIFTGRKPEGMRLKLWENLSTNGALVLVYIIVLLRVSQTHKINLFVATTKYTDLYKFPNCSVVGRLLLMSDHQSLSYIRLNQ